MLNLLAKLHIPPMVGLFCLGFLSCLSVIVLSRYIYVPVVAEIDTFFRPSTTVTPSFDHATILGMCPDESILSILSTPLVNEKTNLGTSVQEYVSSQWLAKRELPIGAENEIRVTAVSPHITVLGQPLSELSIFFTKVDELDLVITKISAQFPAEAPSTVDVLTEQFGPPSEQADGSAVWKSNRGLNLKHYPKGLQLYQEEQPEAPKASPAHTQQANTEWLY